MLTRLAKLSALGCYGLMVLLTGVDNVIDYHSNFRFVQHVLSMDTVFESTTLRWRAIQSASLQHGAFALIIVTELIVAGLCVTCTLVLLKHLRHADSFQRAKRIGITGLTLSLALWFLGFYVIGGEWFASWQSDAWSSTEPGLRLTMLTLVILLFLTRADVELDV